MCFCYNDNKYSKGYSLVIGPIETYLSLSIHCCNEIQFYFKEEAEKGRIGGPLVPFEDEEQILIIMEFLPHIAHCITGAFRSYRELDIEKEKQEKIKKTEELCEFSKKIMERKDI